MIIKKFKPIKVSSQQLDISKVEELTGVCWQYASCGRDAMYHCLLSLEAEGPILVPSYVCRSILEPLKALKLDYVCYDSDLDNLNTNIEDFEKKIIKYDIKVAMVASMYGNPVDFTEIIAICTRHNVLLIDDAAQSFGATFHGRYVGTFGDAGFFSFSPGKPTSGHLGAYFWTKNKEYKIRRKQQFVLHMLAFLDFYLNRCSDSFISSLGFFKPLSYLKIILFRIFNTTNGDVCKFEKPILEKIMHANFEEKFRGEAIKAIISDIVGTDGFRIVTHSPAGSKNHKFVLIVDNLNVATKLKQFLREAGIYVGEGYSNLCKARECSNTAYASERVIELPIEEDILKAKYIGNKIKLFINRHHL